MKHNNNYLRYKKIKLVLRNRINFIKKAIYNFKIYLNRIKNNLIDEVN